ncbi:MAG: DHH family phosphoesterase [Clostridia bacterium]
MMKKNSVFLLLMLLGICGICVVSATLFIHPVGIIACLLVVAAFAVAIIYAHNCDAEISKALNDVFNENSIISVQLINSVKVPCLLFNKRSKIIWSNVAFREIFSGEYLHDVIEDPDLFTPHHSMQKEVNGRQFSIINIPVERKNKLADTIVFQYWLDRTEELHYAHLYEDNMPTAAIIFIDNYDDINAIKGFNRNIAINEVERIVANFARAVNGTYRRYENAQFFVLFERKYLAAVEKNKFDIFNKVHDIETGLDQPITLSIAIGVSESIAKSEEEARNAMELALGRGGDQVVVKRGGKYSFYGANILLSTKNSRVQVRMKSNALRQLFVNASDVFIMGHKRADMDSLGAALGLMRCASSLSKNSYFVLDDINPTIESAIETMNRDRSYANKIKSPEQAIEMIKPTSLLVIVDTQRESLIPSPALLKKAKKIAIVDHHRKSVDSINGEAMSWTESSASSACELVTEILQYFDDKTSLTSFEAGAMLAGISIDTKSFTFNTGARTFDAASFLKRKGADTGTVKLMFRDDIEIFKARVRVVEAAELSNNGIAIAYCPSDCKNPTLIAAQAADTLLSIKGIQASFVIAEADGGYSISARSLGSINVQLIMESLGGGGHLTVAGAQITAVNRGEAIASLKKAIELYSKEVKK